VWIERRLFEVEGAFAADEPSAPAAIFFDARSQHHAWHAGLLEELVPRVTGTDPAALVVASGPDMARAFDTLGALAGTLERVAAVARVFLPRLVAGYRAHLQAATPVADAALARVLRLVVHDEDEALSEAEELLERLGADAPGALQVALEGLRPLEAGLATDGPGLVAWP
jgi:hypothetical protein